MGEVMRRGPRPPGSNTRADILQAAADAFAEQGFDGVSVRQIARGAGVDPALVSYYFGTKRDLFVEAMRPKIPADRLESIIEHVGRTRSGRDLLRFSLGLWDEPDTSQRLVGTLAAATSQPSEAEFMRQLVLEDFLLPVTRRVSPGDPELRAALIASMLLGMTSIITTLRDETLRTLPDEMLLEVWGDEVTRLLVGPLVPEHMSDASATLLETTSTPDRGDNGALPHDEGETHP